MTSSSAHSTQEYFSVQKSNMFDGSTLTQLDDHSCPAASWVIFFFTFWMVKRVLYYICMYSAWCQEWSDESSIPTDPDGSWFILNLSNFEVWDIIDCLLVLVTQVCVTLLLILRGLLSIYGIVLYFLKLVQLCELQHQIEQDHWRHLCLYFLTFSLWTES